ncbi:MAG: LysE family translocator [Verrucomicrobiales bacterium]
MSQDLSLLTFSLLMLGGQFSPGPDMLLLTRNALLHSRRAALLTVCGIALGLLIHCALILGGVAVVLEKSPAAFTVLRFGGAAYLVYLGIRLLLGARRGEKPIAPAHSNIELKARSAFIQGLLTNLLNAKAIVFLLATLTAFHPLESAPLRKWALGGIVVGQALLFWSLFVCALNWPPLRTFFVRRAPAVNTFFGIFLLIAALAAVWPQG